MVKCASVLIPSVLLTAGLVALLLLLRVRRRLEKRKAAALVSDSDTAGDSGGTQNGHSRRSSVDGWMNPDEIQICKRPDGSDWLLGQGNFGKVRLSQNLMF